MKIKLPPAPWVCLLFMGSHLGAGEDAARGFIPSGALLPVFTARTLEGKEFSSGSLAGKPGAIVFVRPGQAESLAALRDLKKLAAELPSGSWRLVAVASGQISAAEAAALAREADPKCDFLLDPDRALYGAFGVVAVPSLAVFDAEKRVRYRRPGLGSDLAPRVAEELKRALGLVPSTAPQPEGAPRRTAPKLELAGALIESGALDRAEALLREAIAEEASLEGSVRLGEVLLKRGKAQEALALFQAWIGKRNGDSRPETGAGRALAALGQRAEAVEVLRRAALHDPVSVEPRIALGELYEAEGKCDLALREFKAVVEMLRKGRGR